MPVGELFLAAFLGMLFNLLASPELMNFTRREGLGKKLDRWSKMLRRIEKVLDDADEKQRTDSAVKDWLDDLRDLAYDLEDVLDEFATEALRQKLTWPDRDQASTSKVRNLIPVSCTGFTPSAVQIKFRLGSKIEEITTRFNEMVKQKDALKLSETVGRRRSYRTREILAPTSVVTEAHVYGREKDKEALLEFLVGEKRGDAQLSVIPILGMGGMGKTTLAQLVYNDEKVQSFFDLKAWACVSEDFDAVTVTKTILESLTSERCDHKDLNWLQVKLKEKLKGMKFLVVLDDLWNENYRDWTILRAPFEAGAPGSTIIITTRNEEVSSKTRTVPAYRLMELSNDDCLSILAHHALGTTDFPAHLNLKDVGEGIVRRCKGSPLAAKVLGGVLRNKVNHDEWEKVLKSKIWDLPEVENEISPALMLSYHHLPSNLKRCFAYCSIFPKDYEFKENELVLLWIAEGFIQPREGEEQMEDLGGEYFRNLLSRSFFQQSSTEKSQFVMHDLINDLAQQVAGDICFKMEDRVGGNNGWGLSRKARHSSYLGDYTDGIKKFEGFSELKCLRTFLPLMLPYPGMSYLTTNALKLLPKLQRLRVLSLSGYCIHELPESIGGLKHLRFLDLSHTQIRSLPESIATLYNLQTLILEYCSSLKKLPSTFGNLVNLRHLNIRGADALEEMPSQISKLTCLQSLSNFVVGKGNFSGVKELGPLLHLRETLCISGLEHVINPKDARDAKLIEKHNLYGLSLEWSRNFGESKDNTRGIEVLNMLQPHEGLKDLTIIHYGCTEFPTWLAVPSFSNMVLLKIKSCAKCTSLPPVGQLPSLRELFIEGMASVKNIGLEFYGDDCLQPFRSLETLYFENMQEWGNWISCEEFPKLRKLFITSCPKLLGKLPNHLPSLENIVICGCKQLVFSSSSFPELCKVEIEGSKGVVHRSKVDFSSLKFSNLSTLSEFTCQMEEFIMGGLTNVEDLTIEECEEMTTLCSNDVGSLQHLLCLGVLKIRYCSKLVSLVEEEVEEQLQLGLPSKLREICIESCQALKSLPKAMMYNNTHLEEICIGYCSSLTHFSIWQLPPNLKRLKIWACNNMQILVDDINSCGSSTSLLEELDISNCFSLKYLTSSGELPATLKHLEIENCKKLELITKRELPATLKHLEIGHCEKLESIAKSFHHNSSLEVIKISYGKNLKSLPKGIHHLSHLDRILFEECPILESFNEQLLPANLKELTINRCEKMQALPNCIHNLTSLQELEMWGCPGIVSFPEGGLPTNLRSLHMCTTALFNEAIFKWGLYKLTSLKKLVICGHSWNLVSFLQTMLPASLTSITIERFPNLECLSSKCFRFLASLEELRIDSCKKLMSFPEDGLSLSLSSLSIQNCEKLTSFPKDALPQSLRSLSIHNCKKLTSFPEDGLPPSLTGLSISNCEKFTSFPKVGLSPSLTCLYIETCEKLTSFPKDRLPLSLLRLYISNCPLLIERCKGREWFKIAHIPYVRINYAFFFKLEEESQ